MYTTGKGQGTPSQVLQDFLLVSVDWSHLAVFPCLSSHWPPSYPPLGSSWEMPAGEGDALVAFQGLDVSGVPREGTQDSLVQLQQLQFHQGYKSHHGAITQHKGHIEVH